MAHTTVPTVAVDDFGKASWANLVNAADVDLTTRVDDLETAGADQLVGVAGSVDKEIVLFDGATGKATERATGTGYVKVAGGVYQTPSATVPVGDISGDLPYSKLAQGSALSVLGVTGNAIADVASIAAASDDQVLRRSGTSVGFGAVNLASSNAITGALPLANLPTNFAQVFRATVTLTDAQIKALRSTPITIVAAPGAGNIIVPVSIVIFAKTTSGAYTNIDTGSTPGNALLYHTVGDPLGGSLQNDTAESITTLSDFLGVASQRYARLLPVFAEDSTGYGIRSFSDVTANGTNQPLQIVMNNAAGDLTGGNAANALKVVVLYSIEAIP